MKKTNLPKYAAALASLCFVPMLAGCDSVQLDGTAPDPNTQVEIAGMESVYTEPDVELAGDEPVYTEPELEGECPVDYEPQPAVTAIPPEELTPERFAWLSEAAFNEACSTLGLDGGSSCTNIRLDYADQMFEPTACVSDHAQLYCVCCYIGTEQTVYDRNAEAVSGTFTEMFEAQETAQKFDWGFIDKALVSKREMTIIDEYKQVIFIDCADGMPLDTERAAQILRDVFGASAEQTPETEAIS